MLKPRPTLNDEWIESQLEDLYEDGSTEFWSSKNVCDWAGWLEKPHDQEFKEAFNNRSDTHTLEWHTQHHYQDVCTHAEALLKDRLKESELYNQVPREDQIDEVNQCKWDAATQLAYLHADSWHKFLKSKGLIEGPKYYQVSVERHEKFTVLLEATDEEQAERLAADMPPNSKIRKDYDNTLTTWSKVISNDTEINEVEHDFEF